jgi:hypothetical protein
VEEISLDAVSGMMSCMTTASALLFPGNLDRARFDMALQVVVEHCPWLLGKYAERDCADGDSPEGRKKKLIVVVPRTEDGGAVGAAAECSAAAEFPGYLRCDYSDRSSECDYSSSIDFESLLPSNVHEKMINVHLCLASVDDLPISALNVVQFSNHFVISYRLNHAFYDQSAIVYLFQFISDVYSHDNTPTIAPPRFYPRVSIIPSGSSFSSEEDLLSAAPKGYSTDPMTGITFGAPCSLRMQLCSSNINSLRQSAASKVSSNDIIHALLMKALSMYQTDSVGSQAVKIYFARNMRTPLGLGREVVGDYVRLEFLDAPGSEAQSESILQLAERSRAAIASKSVDVYPRECMFFRDFNNFVEGRPNSVFLLDKLAAVVTNWSSFPYEEIKFDASANLELLASDTKGVCGNGCFVRVTHSGGASDRQISVVIDSLYPEFIDRIRAVCEESGLARCI